MKYEMTELRKNLLDVIKNYMEMYDNEYFLRMLLTSVGSFDPLYVSDDLLLDILKGNYEYSDYLEDVFNRDDSVMHDVYESKTDFETWNRRDVATISGNSKLYEFTSELENEAYKRFKERHDEVMPINNKCIYRLIDFVSNLLVSEENHLDENYYDEWVCESYLSYIENCGWVRWPEVYRVVKLKETDEWEFIHGTYCKIPFLDETIESCICSDQSIGMHLIFDYESPIYPGNYCELVNYGIYVDYNKKKIVFLDKYRAIDKFHELYRKYIVNDVK